MKKLLLLVPVAAASSAFAAVPTEITGMLDDAGTVWDSVKAFVVGVVVFTVLIGIAKKMRRA